MIRPIETGENEYDDLLGVYTLFLSMPRPETVYFRLVAEAWEDYAVVRTMERFYGPDRTQTLVVVMAVPDYLAPCSRSLARLAAEVEARQVPSCEALRNALRRDLLGPGEDPPPGA